MIDKADRRLYRPTNQTARPSWLVVMSIITAVTVLVVAKREISLQDDALWHAGHIATTPTTAEQCIEIKGDIYTAAAAYRTEYHDLDRRLQQRTIKANVEAWYQHNCGPRP